MDASHLEQSLATHRGASPERGAVSQAIAATLNCAQSCAFCADACLAEPEVADLSRCIRLNLDCAEVCDLTGRMLSRQHEPDMQLLRGALELCSKACDACAGECRRHAGRHRHCRLCMQACLDCQRACNALLGALG